MNGQGAFGRRGKAHPVWTRRRQRVERLRGEHPHAAELLAFYGDVLALQEPLYGRALSSRWLGAVEGADGGPPRLRLSRLPQRSRERAFLRFVRAVPASATDVLRAAAGRLASEPAALSDLLGAVLEGEPVAAVAEALDCGPEALEFFPRAFVQPIAEALVTRTTAAAADRRSGAVGDSGQKKKSDADVAAAADQRSGAADGGKKSDAETAAAADQRSGTDGDGPGLPRPPDLAPPAGPAAGRGDPAADDDARAACPYCGAAPVAAVLRDEPAVKGRRTLLCSLCLVEWAFPRTRCPACGEERADRRPHHVSESWPHIRLEECGSCRTYIKAIDLREAGLAVPVIDEAASVELDLWAAGQGLLKLRTNLLGM